MQNVSFTNPCHARLCALQTWADYCGYGFSLCGSKKIVGQLIREVHPDSPASVGGLRDGDTLIEVNRRNVLHEPHMEVVDRIRADPHRVTLLVVDPEAKEYFRKHNITIDSNMKELERIVCPPHRPAHLTDSNKAKAHTHQPIPLTTDQKKHSTDGPELPVTHDNAHKYTTVLNKAMKNVKLMSSKNSSDTKDLHATDLKVAQLGAKEVLIDEHLEGEEACGTCGAAIQKVGAYTQLHTNITQHNNARNGSENKCKPVIGSEVAVSRSDEAVATPVHSITPHETAGKCVIHQTPLSPEGKPANEFAACYATNLYPSSLRRREKEGRGCESSETIAKSQYSFGSKVQHAPDSIAGDTVAIVPLSENVHSQLEPTLFYSKGEVQNNSPIAVVAGRQLNPVTECTAGQAVDPQFPCAEMPIRNGNAISPSTTLDPNNSLEIELNLTECKVKYLSNNRRKYRNILTSYAERKSCFDRM